jgi:hypothetical protein
MQMNKEKLSEFINQKSIIKNHMPTLSPEREADFDDSIELIK